MLQFESSGPQISFSNDFSFGLVSDDSGYIFYSIKNLGTLYADSLAVEYRQFFILPPQLRGMPMAMKPIRQLLPKLSGQETVYRNEPIKPPKDFIDIKSKFEFFERIKFRYKNPFTKIVKQDLHYLQFQVNNQKIVSINMLPANSPLIKSFNDMSEALDFLYSK